MCPLLTPIYEQMVELGSALWQKVTEFYRMIRRALEVFFLERTDIAVCFTIAEAIFSKPRVNLHNEGFTSTTVAPGTRAELWKKSGKCLLNLGVQNETSTWDTTFFNKRS